MIIYKRRMTQEDVVGLEADEELIYYKTDDIAVTVIQHDNRYIVRKRQISDNKIIEEAPLNTVDEVMDFIETL